MDQRGGTLSLLIYPDRDSSFDLYEDDGATAIQLSVASTQGNYAGMPPSRAVLAQIYLPTPPDQVTLDGSGVLPSVQNETALEALSPTWRHDGERFLRLSFSQVQAQVDITITL